MAQSEEALTFFHRLEKLKSGEIGSIDEVLGPSTVTQNLMRRDLRLNFGSPLLQTPFSGLVDVYDAPEETRRALDDAKLGNVFRLPSHLRHKPGDPCMTEDLEGFQDHWRGITRGILDELEWENIVVAGGAVHACLEFGASNSVGSKEAWLRSDIDLFPWGLGQDDVEIKIEKIHDMLDRRFPGEVYIKRSMMSVSFELPPPFRTIQVVLKQLPSPAAVLASFDLDIACFLYDGKRVYATPNAMGCMMRQCIVADVARYTSTFELRLAKYALRGYEIYVPLLERRRVDDNIFRVSLVRLRGLALLLALENVMKDRSLEDNMSMLQRLSPGPGYDYMETNVFRGNARKIELGKVVDLDEMELFTAENPNAGALDIALWYATAYRNISR